MQEIEIRFGNSWKDDELLKAQYRRYNTIDLTNVLDVVDILVGGANISVQAPKDSIFLLLRDLLSKVEDLLSHKAKRVSISFYESSWELVLLLRASEVLLSFYRAGARPKVEVKDRKIGLAELVEAVVQAGESLIEDLLDVSPGMKGDPYLSELLSGIERLKGADLRRAASGPLPSSSPCEVEYLGKGDGRSPITIGYRMTATPNDILAQVIPHRSDLYSLMAYGEVRFFVEGRELQKSSGYLFFIVDKLLEVTRSILAAVDDQRDLDQIFSVEELEIDLKCSCVDRSCTLTIRDRSAEQPPLVVSKVDPLALVEETLLLGRDLRRRIVELNSGQRTNLRFELFSEEIDLLSTWRKELESQTTRKRIASSLKYEVPAPSTPDREEEGCTVLTRTRKLMYIKLWDAEVENLKLEASYLCGDRVILTGERETYALQRETGEVLWRKELEEPNAVTFMAGETGLLRFDSDGMLRLTDIKNGETVWTTRITPPFGPPSGVIAGGGRKPRIAVFTSGEASLVGIDLYTGEARWRQRTRRGSSYRFGKFGKLLLVTSSTNALYCFDVESGELLWRFCGRYKFMDPPVCSAGLVAVWGREWGERSGRLHLFDSLRGEEHWTAGCEGRLAGNPLFAGGVVCAAFHFGRELIVKGWKLDGGTLLWERDLGNFVGFFSWMPIDNRIVMNIAGGIVICIQAEDGTVAWSRSVGTGPGEEDIPLNLEPVLRGGGLFIPADTTYVFSPADGTLLHRLNKESPVPDFLRVDERYSIYVGEVSGYFSVYGVSGHLGVVDEMVVDEMR